MNRNCAVMLGRQAFDASIFSGIDVFEGFGTTGGMQNGKAESASAAPFWTMLLLIALAVLLFFFSPTEFSFYPRCYFHALTGLDCPGCGSLRAAHQLLHGNFKIGFGLNPLFVLALPLFLSVMVLRFARISRAKSFWNLNLQRRFVWTLIAVAAVFGIVRNFPAFSALTH